MANTDFLGGVSIDTTGAVTTDIIKVQSIMIAASADNPVVVFNDASGNEIYRFTTAIANMRAFGTNIGPTLWHGLTAVTLTNITRVFIYRTAFNSVVS